MTLMEYTSIEIVNNNAVNFRKAFNIRHLALLANYIIIKKRSNTIKFLKNATNQQRKIP
jgi:hypothetical protein